MQVKIVIATVAFMLTMIIFGYAALREPARMERTAEAFEARTIEKGAELYFSNCSGCHGLEGKAQECIDVEGFEVGCIGLPLNDPGLVCGSRPARIEAIGWGGSKESYVNSVVTVGRNQMPTWGVEYGGPLEPYQVDQVVSFVLNWERDDICLLPTPTPVPWPASAADLPPGDAANGAILFNGGTLGCATCHGAVDQPGSNAVGPWAGDVADEAAGRIDGYTAADYVYESILLPSEYIVEECPTGPCAGPISGMPGNFGQRIGLQEMSDIMAYLLETSTFESSTEIEYNQ